MNVFELGEELKKMYRNAPVGYKVCMIHLFGIRYFNHIIAGKISAAELCYAAGINASYATEVSKGVKLARYVKEK